MGIFGKYYKGIHFNNVMFMKKLILLIVLLVAVNTYSQKVIYFSSPKEDSISVKSLNTINLDIASNINTYGISGSFNMGILRESKIGKSTTLLTGLNLLNSTYRYYPDFDNLQQFDTKYMLQASLYAEPRWYFNYKSRTMNGLNTKLNSSWFLGLPIILSTSDLTETSYFTFHLLTAPVVGFRYAFSEKLYFESAAGLGIYTDFVSITPAPYFKARIGYCFK